jgi:hypothetical protein
MPEKKVKPQLKKSAPKSVPVGKSGAAKAQKQIVPNCWHRRIGGLISIIREVFYAYAC